MGITGIGDRVIMEVKKVVSSITLRFLTWETRWSVRLVTERRSSREGTDSLGGGKGGV